MRKKIYFLVVCFSFAVCTAFAANTSVSSRSIPKHTQDTSTTDYNIRTNQKKVARSTIQRSNKTTPQTNLADRKSSKTLKSRSGVNKTITPPYSTVNNISSRSNPDNSSIKKRSQTRTPSLNHVYNNRDQNSSINAKKQLSFVSRAAEIDKKVVADVKSKNLSLCKTTYYDCMDEFCANKDSSLRRCACSKRIHEFDNIKKQLANFEDEMLNFNQRLLTVSMSKEDAAAINVATEGEEAYQTKDSSESQKLLDKITSALNSSGDTKLNTNLSAISLSLDKSAAWDNIDSTAGISTTSKEGIDLYNAALPVCQDMAKEVCFDEEFDIIKDNYLLSIEQDCNTVAKSYDSQYNAAKDKIYESSALLDMSRLNAYQQKNSDDPITCKSKMLEGLYSTSVCGNDLYKCLDITGRYIDPSTGEAFLSKNLSLFTNLLQEPSTNQTWVSVPNNSNFINFLNTKKEYLTDTFANCQDSADIIWKDFLNDALAKIKIAQNAKIAEVKQSCVTLLSECTSLTLETLEDFDARALSVFSLQANMTANQMCSDIKESCISLMNTQSDWTEGIKGISDDILFSKIIENCTLVGKNCIIEQCDGIAGNFSLCTNMSSQKYKDIISRSVCWEDIQNCVGQAIEDINVTYSNTNGTYDSNIDNIGLGATFFQNVYGSGAIINPLCSPCIDEKKCKTCMVAERIFGNCSAAPTEQSSKILESIKTDTETVLSWFAKNVNSSSKENNCSTQAQEYTLTYKFENYGPTTCTQTFSDGQWPFLCTNTNNNLTCTETKENGVKNTTDTCPTPKQIGYRFVFHIGNTKYYTNSKYYSPGNVEIVIGPDDEEKNKYTIIFDANGGGGSMNKTTCTYGEVCNLSNTYTKTGYKFKRWTVTINNKKYDLDGKPQTLDKNGDADWEDIIKHISDENITLCVEWETEKYNIEYELNGGTNYANAPQNYTTESDDITFGTPKKIGYLFTKWYTNQDLTNEAPTTIYKGSIGNIKLYAGWTPITYKCEEGYYLAQKNPGCTACPKGSSCSGGTYIFSETKDQGITACATGTYQESTGKASCTPASAGYYVDSTGAISQTACAAGTYQESTGKTSCTACAAGTYQESTGKASCTPASAGYYVTSTGATSQTACAAGTYQTSTGKTSCTPASAGYYVDSTGAISQTACAAGTYQESTGKASCTACPAADSGWTAKTAGAQSTSYTACYETITPQNCSAGLLKRTASSASAYSTTVTVITTLVPAEGFHVSGNSCVAN